MISLDGVIQYDLAHILHPAFCCKPLLSSLQLLLLLPSHKNDDYDDTGNDDDDDDGFPYHPHGF